MELGIIGLPQVGKKHIFKILTGMPADRAPSKSGITYGSAAVRDPRIDILSAMYNPRRTKYAEFNIALPPDIAPDSMRGAEWLEPLRKVDAFLHIVRAFEADDVFHIKGSVDPARDLGLVDAELLFADLDLAEKRLERINKERARLTPALKQEEEILKRFQQHLESEQSLRTLTLNEEDLKIVRNLQFMTLKPLVVVFNTGENLETAQEQLAKVVQQMANQDASVVFLSAAIEAELMDLPDEERKMFMDDLGIVEPATHRLSRAAFECLGLISFFTVGPDEVRAWPVAKGAKAPEAAGRIHSDLERGFIRAETIAYDDLIAAGSERDAKARNLYHLNGKDYVVRDGDIINIRFSV